MSKNSSIGITDDNYEVLKKASVRKGVSMASIVNNIIEQVGVADKEEKVILSIPSSLTRRNKEDLRQWLQVRMEALLNVYYPKKAEKPENAVEFKTD